MYIDIHICNYVYMCACDISFRFIFLIFYHHKLMSNFLRKYRPSDRVQVVVPCPAYFLGDKSITVSQSKTPRRTMSCILLRREVENCFSK